MISSTQTNHPFPRIGKGARSPGPIELATTRLKSAGLRITQPRLAILAVLSRHEQPISIDQIHQEVGAANCDLVTVYRCMAAFEEIGLVRRAFFHNGTALYEISLDRAARYHVVCKSTDRVEELDAATAEELRRSIDAVEAKLLSLGYRNVGHIVEFFGVSPSSGRASSAAAAPR